jgi:hypothetical protein
MLQFRIMRSTRRSLEGSIEIAAFTLCCVLSLLWGFLAKAQTGLHSAVSIEIVLPARLAAGRPATLATLGADHKLAGHVTVELGSGQRIRTDATGRANFTAPVAAVLLARAPGTSVAALIDSERAADVQRELAVPPLAALHNSFNICGGGFQGNAEANQAEINDEPALVLAASPECLVVIPDPKTATGPAKIAVESSGAPRQASITFVSLDFEPPQPPLTPRKKSWLTVHARGSNQRLRILVENDAPDVLQFEKGEAQALVTSGGTENEAQIKVEALRSGDFAFRARLLPAPDTEAARRFLEAAEPLALERLAHSLKSMEDELSHPPRATDQIRDELEKMLPLTSPGDFRTLLEAARSAL